MHRLLIAVLCVLTLSCGRPPAAPEPTPPNVVAAYLDGAEMQAETDAQRREILRALTDMLDKPAAELRQQRYADYQGNASAWPVTKTLTAHFVPRTPQALDPERFYQDVGKPEARAVIRRTIEEVRKALAPAS